MAAKKSSDLAREIGQILSRHLDEIGWSNRTLAEKANVSHMTVGRALDGDSSVSVDTLMTISNALGLSAWRVYREAEEKLSE